MQSLIDHEQTGFMPGRRMAVNVRKVFDVMAYCQKMDIPAWIMNLDFHKAFDCCEIPSILAALRCYGMPEYIVKWVEILYTDFKIKIQNNGNFSDPVSINRSVHQGGCASAPLFNCCAQILTSMMKSSVDVSPIRIGEIDQILDQYADDTDVFSLHEQESLTEIERILNEFQKNVGLSVSYEKTTIYRIGSLRDSNASLYTTKPIAWSSVGINMLGIYVTHNNSLMSRNYDDLLVKSNAVLNMWKKRDLSIIGRVQIINSLIASMYVHKMTVLPSLGKKDLQRIDSMFNSFIWKDRKAKIPLSSLQMAKADGGLGLTNLHVRDMALKVTWVQILSQDDICSNIAMEVFSPVLKEKIFSCSFRVEDVKWICPSTTSQFWHDMLKAWAVYVHSSYYWNNYDDQIIWWNSDIRINNRPFVWKKCFKRGLVWISDLYPNGVLLGCMAAYNLYGLSIMEYNSLVAAIPTSKRKVCKEADLVKPTFYLETLQKKHLARTAYYQMLPQTDRLKDLAKRWAKEVPNGVMEDSMVAALRAIYVTTNISKLRSFQYRLLQRALVFNTHLQRWGLITSDLCLQCDDYTPETLKHCLFDCPSARSLWKDVETYSASFSSCNAKYNYENIVFNKVVRNRRNIKNFICLVCKQYIYAQRCLKKPLNFHELRAKVLQYKNIELYIAKKNGHIKKYEKKWCELSR